MAWFEYDSLYFMNIDLKGNHLKNVTLEYSTRSTFPSIYRNSGTIIYDTGTNVPYFYNGTSWISLSSEDATANFTNLQGGLNNTDVFYVGSGLMSVSGGFVDSNRFFGSGEMPVSKGGTGATGFVLSNILLGNEEGIYSISGLRYSSGSLLVGNPFYSSYGRAHIVTSASTTSKAPIMLSQGPLVTNSLLHLGALEMSVSGLSYIDTDAIRRFVTYEQADISGLFSGILPLAQGGTNASSYSSNQGLIQISGDQFVSFDPDPSSSGMIIATDGSGFTYVSGGGGGSSTLAALTDTDVGTVASGQILTYDGTDWKNTPIGTGGAPGGSTGEVQYNNAGSFAGASGITIDMTGMLFDDTNDIYIRTRASADSSGLMIHTKEVPSVGLGVSPDSVYMSRGGLAENYIAVIEDPLNAGETLASFSCDSCWFNADNIYSFNAHTLGDLSGPQQLRFGSVLSSNYVALQIASIPGSQITYTIPNAYGTSGYVLADDGAGTLAWISAGGAEVNDLTSSVTWANVPDGNITESSVTQHEAAIDHDALTNFVGNEHINHTSVSITAGEGLTGGGTIAATRTIDLDINGLTVDASPNGAADYVATYDASAGSHKKVLLDDLPGGGGSSTLSGLTDTDVAAATSGQVLTYDGTDWKGTDAAGGGGFKGFSAQYDATDHQSGIADSTWTPITTGFGIIDFDTNSWFSSGTFQPNEDGKYLLIGKATPYDNGDSINIARLGVFKNGHYLHELDYVGDGYSSNGFDTLEGSCLVDASSGDSFTLQVFFAFTGTNSYQLGDDFGFTDTTGMVRFQGYQLGSAGGGGGGGGGAGSSTYAGLTDTNMGSVSSGDIAKYDGSNWQPIGISEMFAGTSFPSEPYDGQSFKRTDLSESFTYDTTRSKWLGELRWYDFGRSVAATTTNNNFIGPGNVVNAADRGYHLGNNITIVGYEWHSDTAFVGILDVRRNNVDQLSVNASGFEGYNRDTNVSVASGTHMHAAYNTITAGQIAHPTLRVYYRTEES